MDKVKNAENIANWLDDNFGIAVGSDLSVYLTCIINNFTAFEVIDRTIRSKIINLCAESNIDISSAQREFTSLIRRVTTQPITSDADARLNLFLRNFDCSNYILYRHLVSLLIILYDKHINSLDNPSTDSDWDSVIRFCSLFESEYYERKAALKNDPDDDSDQRMVISIKIHRQMFPPQTGTRDLGSEQENDVLTRLANSVASTSETSGIKRKRKGGRRLGKGNTGTVSKLPSTDEKPRQISQSAVSYEPVKAGLDALSALAMQDGIQNSQENDETLSEKLAAGLRALRMYEEQQAKKNSDDGNNEG